jgi:TonB-dependent receptor
LDFTEPANQGAGMNGPPSSLKTNPELIIPYAWNNFQAAYCTTGYNRSQNNLDKEKTGYLNVARKYSLMDWISGELKVGGKYKEKDRFKNNFEGYAPYYLGYFKKDVILSDGTIVPKNYDGSWNGTRFAQFITDFQANTRQTPSFSEFLDSPPGKRNLYDKYLLNPIVGRDAMSLWFNLNKNGYESQTQSKVEFISNQLTQGDWYQVTERVSAAYVMNTLNIGQNIIFVAGVRVEQEDNDYVSRYTPSAVGTPLFPSGDFRDTSRTYKETILLPNFHLTLKPTDFLNVRLAAYRALSRPDFNMRLGKFVAQSASGSNSALILGNPDLKTAKAWNYEVNTSVFDNNIGLINVSAYYKEIKDMYLMLTDASTHHTLIIDYFGLKWQDAFGGSNYNITVPYNSPKSTKIWGFEFEHQINFGFLPGLLKNFVLTYNASLVRSETYVLGTTTDTTYEYMQILPLPFPPSRLPVYTQRLIDRKQRLEGEPEFFGNIALGYDIGRLSARISVYHQGKYNKSFTANSRKDAVQGSFTRIDLSLKYQFTNYLTAFFNINNINNTKEDDYIANRVIGYEIPNTSERYGTTADLGVRVTL